MASRPSSSASQASKFAELLVELGSLDAAADAEFARDRCKPHCRGWQGPPGA